MRLLFTLFIAFVTVLPAMAQKKSTDNFSVLRPSKSGKWADRIARTKSHARGLSLGIGMNMSFMQNAAFGQQVGSGKVSHDFAFKNVFSAFGLRATILPVIIDMSFHSSVPFHYSSGLTFTREREVRNPANGFTGTVIDTLTTNAFRHRGMNFSVSVAAFTFSRIIYPYVGIGYSFSYLGDGDAFIPEETLISSNTSAPFWKVGLAIHPIRRLIITAEYASSVNQIGDLSINPGRDFAMAEFSIRYQFFKFRKDMP